MNTNKDVLNSVKERLTPDKKDIEKMNFVNNKLLKTAEKYKKAMICGSSAKGTWLPNRNEVDLFLLFDENDSRETLTKEGLKIAKKIVKELKGKWKLSYSEHPYIKSTIKFNKTDFDVDIVPCFDIKNSGKIKSAVDRTPHHVRYIMGNMNKEQKTDVRLLKQFCKNNGCYGADLRIQGFSGYLCELMILKYGNFLNCLKESQKWTNGTCISFSNCDKKFENPLIFVDPVDAKRNVAAAVSLETMMRFIETSKEFLSKPSDKFFFEDRYKPITSREIFDLVDRRKTEWFIIKFSKPKILEDILWSQMRRSIKSLGRMLKEKGFEPLKLECWSDEKNCIFIFEMQTWKIPEIYKHIGPEVDSKQAKGFLERYKGEKVFIENKNYVVERKRKYTNVYDLLKEIINKNTVEMGIPKNISKSLKKSVVIKEKNIPSFIKKMNKDFLIFLRRYFEENLNYL